MSHALFMWVCLSTLVRQGLANAAQQEKFLDSTVQKSSTQEDLVALDQAKNALISASERLSSSIQDKSALLSKEGPLAKPQGNSMVAREAALDEHLTKLAEYHGVVERRKTDVGVMRHEHGSLPAQGPPTSALSPDVRELALDAGLGQKEPADKDSTASNTNAETNANKATGKIIESTKSGKSDADKQTTADGGTTDKAATVGTTDATTNGVSTDSTPVQTDATPKADESTATPEGNNAVKADVVVDPDPNVANKKESSGTPDAAKVAGETADTTADSTKTASTAGQTADTSKTNPTPDAKPDATPDAGGDATKDKDGGEDDKENDAGEEGKEPDKTQQGNQSTENTKPESSASSSGNQKPIPQETVLQRNFVANANAGLNAKAETNARAQKLLDEVKKDYDDEADRAAHLPKKVDSASLVAGFDSATYKPKTLKPSTI